MKKEIKKYTVVCDICETELFDNGIRTNCGKFEEPFFKSLSGKIDLCYTCAGKLFATQIAIKLPEVKLTEMVEKTRKRIGSDNSLGSIKINNILPTGGFIGTNSADTLFCANENENQTPETPETPEEKARNGMFNVHPESEIKFQTSKDIDTPKNLKDL